MTGLTVDTRQLDDITVIYPRGFINAHTVRLFEAEIQKSLDQNKFRLVVNCVELSYVASAGLGAIMGVIDEIRRHGGDLRLAGVNETVLNIFEILGFHHLYRIFPSEIEAVRSFRDDDGPGH